MKCWIIELQSSAVSFLCARNISSGVTMKEKMAMCNSPAFWLLSACSKYNIDSHTDSEK